MIVNGLRSLRYAKKAVPNVLARYTKGTSSEGGQLDVADDVIHKCIKAFTSIILVHFLKYLKVDSIFKTFKKNVG